MTTCCSHHRSTPGPTQDELIRHYETVLDAVEVNLVLYSYPAKDGADINFELMDHFADNPRVIAIKESSGVLQRAIDIVSRYEGRNSAGKRFG